MNEKLTEQRLAESMELDRLPIAAALKIMNDQDARAVAAVADQREQIARAVEIVCGALRENGRLIYVGAGTSGRLGVLDAAECPPTFGTEAQMVQGIIAGGEPAMFRSAEGAEDREENGATAMDERNVSERDVVLGIAASGTTPFVRGALHRARERRAATIFLCCVEATAGEPAADLVIRPLTGPEMLTGSTRLKAGTATKLILNQITTLAMVRLGKAYENLMVDLRATNAKLRDRSLRIVKSLTGLNSADAMKLLESAGGKVKVAVMMHRRKVDAVSAGKMLDDSKGFLRAALES